MTEETEPTLTREKILGAPDLVTERVPIHEWNGAVNVRSLTAAARDAFEASCFTGQGGERRTNLLNLRARLVALSVVDDEGHRLFSEQDVAALGEKNAAAVERLFVVAQRLSGLGQGDLEALKGNS